MKGVSQRVYCEGCITKDVLQRVYHEGCIMKGVSQKCITKSVS